MAVQLEGLSLATLEVLDPRIEVLFQKQVQLIANDCMNRPREKAKRKLIFEMQFEPMVDPDTGECEEVKVSIDGKSTLPPFRTRPYPMHVTKAGLKFNSEVPDESAATA